VGDDLLDGATVRRREQLGLPDRAIDRLGVGEAANAAHGLVGGEQVRHLPLERDRERVLGDRGLVAPAGGLALVERHGAAQRPGGGTGNPHGHRGHAVRLIGGEPVRRGEAPRAVHDDTNAEPLALAGGHALDAPRLDRDELVESPDDPDIRPAGPQGRGGVDGPGGEIAHRAGA
jgi:hypothetical protein